VALFHHVDLRVLWADTDPAGIVWFGVFCRYFEQAEEELFRALGRDRTALLADLQIFMPRTSMQSRFKSPAKLGDEIAVGVGVTAITDRRIEYAFDIRERATDRLICDACYRVACVDQRTFAPRAFPRAIVELLTPALAGSAETGLRAAREASAER
jgi:YbgC/YbaW family acyl-CoA thioester hydrolase